MQREKQMHWLKKYRMDHIMSRKQLAARIRTRGKPNRPETAIGCSETLIEILEGGGITHPEIANRIAEVTGATAEQRDSIVHKMHRGTWQPKAKPKKITSFQEGRRPQPMTPGVVPENAEMVVRIARGGYETGRYVSQSAAAQATGCSITTVRNRCARKLRPGTEEFGIYGCTFRYAQEWDAMDAEARMADLGFRRC